MLGPLLEDVKHPVKTFGRIVRDRAFYRYWLADWAYYYACGFFDGRRPPDYDRLAPFRLSSHPGEGRHPITPPLRLKQGLPLAVSMFGAQLTRN
jgi:hypothetical protein